MHHKQQMLNFVLRWVFLIWLLLAPIRDRKTTVRKVEFFTPFNRKLLSDFNYIKNFLGRGSNSGKIVQNVWPRPLRFGIVLMSYLESFLFSDRFLIGHGGAYFSLSQSNAESGLLHNCVYPRDKVDRQKRGKSIRNGWFQLAFSVLSRSWESKPWNKHI